jgi:NitT/TauT family transport system substrate-binding protein
MVVDSAALEANPALGRALAGAWYEAMRLMASPGPDGVAARRAMAEAAGTDLEGYEAQLYTTRMFYDPAEAAFFANYDETKEMNASVVAFLGEKGLLGEGVAPREIGISYPDGTVTGDPANVLLRFDDRFMAGAAAGEG